MPSIPKIQLFILGWCGEKYIANMLVENYPPLLSELGMNRLTQVKWFNQGFDRHIRNWEDQSVGMGCDIQVSDGNRDILIEVKTSQRRTNFIAMTTLEIQAMERCPDDYYLVKLDGFENILLNKAPSIRVYAHPYERFFTPERVINATFSIE